MPGAEVDPTATVVDPSRGRRARRRGVWRGIAVLLTAGATVWVLLLLKSTWPQLAANAGSIRVLPLLSGLLLGLAATYLTFGAFAMLAEPFGVRDLRTRELAHFYFTAQLLKHLPGRVWGIGYQSAAGSSFASLGHWVLLNLVQMALATYFALSAAGVVLAYAFAWHWSVAVAMATSAVYALGWVAVSRCVPAGLKRYLPGRLGRVAADVFATLQRVPLSTRARIFGVFAMSWGLYYASWYANGLAYPALGGSGGVQLCAYYMIAWFVGYVSLLTPSGFGIRELVFIWLAKDFSADAVALMTLIGRAGLTLIDLLLGVAFAPFVAGPRDD